MHACPHCGKPEFTVVRKFSFWPSWPGTCNACGGKAGISWVWRQAIQLPLMVGVLLSLVLEPFALKLAVAGGGLIVTVILFLRPAPLARRKGKGEKPEMW